MAEGRVRGALSWRHSAVTEIRLDATLRRWRDALGAEAVIIGGPRLDLANRATYAIPARAPAIVEPADRDGVRAAVAIANEEGVPLYPVSRGLNWGYGSMAPSFDGAVILSLRRLDRILEVDDDLAFARIEPGVTFGALAEGLRERGSRLHAPLTGSSIHGSIIGNALECGVAKFPYDALPTAIAEMEVVLADGSIVRTGPSAFCGAQAAGLDVRGPGPSLGGLFLQSNFGVVTEAALTLQPSAKLRQRIVLQFRHDEALAACIDALRDVLQRNRGRIQLELANAYRVVTQSGTFPWHEHDGSLALPRSWARHTLGPSFVGWWVGAVTIACDDEDELRIVRERFRMAVAQIAGAECGEAEAYMGEGMGHDGLRSAYWRKREPMPADPHPDRDGCGVFWISPVLPMRGTAMTALASELEEIAIAGGFEPSISARSWDGRTLRVVLGIFYDRAVPLMDERAAACHEALLRASYRCGAIPYRLGLAGMALLPPRCDDGEAFLRRLKDAVDPRGILAPGRFIR